MYLSTNFHELQLVESNANKNRALAPFTFLFLWAKAQIPQSIIVHELKLGAIGKLLHIYFVSASVLYGTLISIFPFHFLGTGLLRVQCTALIKRR